MKITKKQLREAIRSVFKEELQISARDSVYNELISWMNNQVAKGEDVNEVEKTLTNLISTSAKNIAKRRKMTGKSVAEQYDPTKSKCKGCGRLRLSKNQDSEYCKSCSDKEKSKSVAEQYDYVYANDPRDSEPQCRGCGRPIKDPDVNEYCDICSDKEDSFEF